MHKVPYSEFQWDMERGVVITDEKRKKRQKQKGGSTSEIRVRGTQWIVFSVKESQLVKETKNKKTTI